MKMAWIALFRKRVHDMMTTAISRRGQQQWVSLIYTSATSPLFMIILLFQVFNPTTTVYASIRLLAPTRPLVSTHTLTSNTLCARAIFCDSFENQSGLLPSGAWQISYPSCKGTGTITIDHTRAHSGRTSIRVNGRAGYCNHVFIGSTRAFTGIGTDLHVRFFVQHTTALPSGHVAFVAMKDTHDGGKDLRMGAQNKALQWNRESDDQTLPVQSPTGVALSAPLPTNQWQCIEFEVNEAKGTMSTWLNGIPVKGLQLDNVPTPDVDSQWLSRKNWRPDLADLRLGWESYAGSDDTLWFDDVAVGRQRIGCA
jgi:hypothetical protein